MNEWIKNELENNKVKDFHPELITSDQISNFNKMKREVVFDIVMEKTRSYNEFLWNSCSMDEKLILLRLSEDRFLPNNPANISILEVLFRRGLIKREPNIKPFNIFFTQFILEANRPEEKFWREQESKSAWGKFRVPALLLLLGIVVFLFTTQSEVYSSTLTIITASSALIPALLRLFGMFQPSGGHKSAG